jgi:hypothetical protein
MTAAAVRAVRMGMGAASTIAVGAALTASGMTLASLAGGGVGRDPFTNTTLRFPDDLGNIDHWISFEAVQTNGAAANLLSGFGVSIGSNFNVAGGSVYLPLPSQLSTKYDPQYTDENLGMAAGAALKPFDRQMYGNTDIPGAAAVGAGMAAVTTSVAKNFLPGAQQVLSGASTLAGGQGSVDAALKVFGGVAQNPHKIVLFTGVNFRQHQFTWKLSPKNRTESNQIRSIIDFFKYYSHPEYVAGGLFFKYPEFFRIRFHHPEYLFEIRPSVCEDVSVNYHTQGYPAYVREADGSGIPAPAEIELSLSFKETEIITKNSLNPPQRITIPTQTIPNQSIGPVQIGPNGPIYSPGA